MNIMNKLLIYIPITLLLFEYSGGLTQLRSEDSDFKSDYIKNHEVFGGYMDDSEEHFSATQYGIAVITERDKKTGRYIVKFIIPSDQGTKITKKVITKTHPASKNTLKPGTPVLCNFYNPTKNDFAENKRGSRWELNIVRAIKDDVVIVDFYFNKHTKKGSEDHRINKYYIWNVRVVDSPLIIKK